MRRLPFLLAVLAALALAACDLSGDEPLAPGTFEVVVTGDAEGEHAGGPVWVAAPDSGRGNVGSPDEYWAVGIPIAFQSSLADGDEVEVGLYIGEPVEPNGSFTEIPEGTYDLGEYDPRRPVALGTVRTAGLNFGPGPGTLRLRRAADGGLVGDLDARWVAPRFKGRASRGRVRLRFHALAERPEGADER
jgi:hypothetical protein